MTCTENAKPDLKDERASSYPPVDRRVIFPSLYPERFQKVKEQNETTSKSTLSSPDSVSTLTKEDETRPMVPLSMFPIRSPGLPSSRPPAASRLYDELDLEVSRMSLDDTSVTSPSPPPPPPPPRASPKQVCPSPTEPVARCVSLDRAPTARRNRIDRNHYSARPDSFFPPAGKKMCKPLPSILRPSKVSGSLPSLSSIDNDSNTSSESLNAQVQDSSHSKRAVSFDPIVRVVEYERSQEETERTWFSPDELDHFRMQTIARLVAHNTQLLPSGTGFVVQKTIPCKAFFAFESMGSASEDDDEDLVESAVNKEIRNVLVVDPHDTCLKLFSNDFRSMIPDVNVCAARSSEEAMKLIECNYRFDIVVVEERLKPLHRHAREKSRDFFSGSEFIKTLSKEMGNKCLFIAVSAHLDKDKETMQKSCADFIWAKPPPRMDEIMRDVLLKAILIKRGKHSEADKLFGSIMGSL